MIIKIPITLANEANGHKIIKKGYEFAKVKKYRAEHPAETRERHRLQKLIVKSFLESSTDSFPLPCSITLTRHAPRSFDDDNLGIAFKWVRDQVAQCLLGGLPGKKDSDPRLKWQYAQEKTKDSENFITISLEAVSKEKSERLPQ